MTRSPVAAPVEATTQAAHRVLSLHLEARDHRGLGPAAALLMPAKGRLPDCDNGIVALAAAAVAETFGWIDGERALALRGAMERALHGGLDTALDAASPAAVLAWCCAAAEWCEREGLDDAFTRLQPRAAAADAAGPAFWRVHWRIAAAWHHESFGRFADVGRLLREAHALARADGSQELGAVTSLHLARLALARADAAAALDHAARAIHGQGEAEAPLWHAHAADVCCRVALSHGDFHAALQRARRCHGLAQAANVSPAYAITFRLHEVYAEAGLGAHAEAVMLARRLAAIAQPRHLQQRIAVLAQLFELGAAIAEGHEVPRTLLADALRRLRELQWPGVLALLPQRVSQIWAQALELGVEADWVVASILHRDLAPPGLCRPAAWPWALRLRVLGAFEIVGADGQALSYGAKAASRPLELLRRLAAVGGYDGLAVEPLARELWPGEAREGRQKVFEVTLARLRKLLGVPDALLLHDHRLRLNPRRVWLDRVALEQSLLALTDPRLEGVARQAHWHQALSMWRGPLLGADDAAAPWLLDARNALRGRFAAGLLADAALPGHHSRCLRALAADGELAAWINPRHTLNG